MSIAAVAKRAGVSKATVSRVINGTATVVPETARRVRDAIAELDFHPDVNARTLGSGRSHLYGLIISDITNPYFPELVKAFEDVATEYGEDVLISNTDYDPRRMERCVIRMLGRKVDGVAVMTSEMDERLLLRLRERRIPTIFMDTAANVPGAGVVSIDYEDGMRQALAHVYELGHRRIGFISGPLTLTSARRRLDGFRAALRDHGLAENAQWLQHGDHRVEGGHQAMRRMLDAVPLPTAVLTSNDLTAIGAIGAIHERGLSVPRDLSLVGFDDIELSAYTQPALTTVQVSRRALADLAFRFLYEGRQRPAVHSDEPLIVKPALLIRGSTAPPSV